MPPAPEPEIYKLLELTLIYWLPEIQFDPDADPDQLAPSIVNSDRYPVPLTQSWPTNFAATEYSEGKFFAWDVYKFNTNLQSLTVLEYFMHQKIQRYMNGILITILG